MESFKQSGHDTKSFNSQELDDKEKEIVAIKKKIKISEGAVGSLIKKGEYDSEESEKEKIKIKLLQIELEKLLDDRYLLHKKRNGVEFIDEIISATTKDKKTKRRSHPKRFEIDTINKVFIILLKISFCGIFEQLDPFVASAGTPSIYVLEI